MELRKIGRSRVVTVSRNTGLQEAAKLMREEHVGDVIVTELRSGRKIPVGILTDRDLVISTVAIGVDPAIMTVSDVMTVGLVTVYEDESLSEVIYLMKENGVKRVPILGPADELVGVIALEDIMAYLADEFSELSAISAQQRVVEYDRRRRIA